MSATSYCPEPYPHQWLPADVELKSWEQIEPWYGELLARLIASTAELEHWLRDTGELSGAVSQEGVRRYIAMTCQTDDPERERAHLEWVR
ncbi:MAG TPA: M3 family oligoendopeptidase, partial [Isosphaeraceae bacterium]|nr:M3 family oligoendopeptidase [Isosphaeraceae bacterium]